MKVHSYSNLRASVGDVVTVEVYEYPEDQCKEELADELVYHFQYEGTKVLNSAEQMFDATSNTFRLQFSGEGTD